VGGRTGGLKKEKGVTKLPRLVARGRLVSASSHGGGGERRENFNTSHRVLGKCFALEENASQKGDKIT